MHDMNTATIIACAGFVVVFALAWAATEALAQYKRSKKAMPRPLERRCAWCDEEAGIKAKPHYSHGICKLHASREMEKAQPKK
jgi:hypothetical protein